MKELKEIEFGEFRDFWSISQQLVPTKIIRKLAIWEDSET